METDKLCDLYYRHLGALDPDDFIEACGRIVSEDQWFPTIARIKAVAHDCRADRLRRQRALTETRYVERPLVCPYCHGARFVRLGGYDPNGMRAGEPGSRVQACPKCTLDGVYDAYSERAIIAEEHGVPDERAERIVDLAQQQWPHTLRALRDPATGRINLDALYRQSRILRGLDPDVDERPAGVAGFKTFADVAGVA